jgi:hypothetical protein
MQKTCALIANGYEILFHLKDIEQYSNSIGIILVCNVKTTNMNYCLQSKAQLVRKDDLRRMIAYLENHIQVIQENLYEQSTVFVTYDNVFQMEALSGICLGQSNDGYFTLRFMFNAGFGEVEGRPKTNTYVGAEAVVYFESIQNFIESIDTFLSTSH